LRRTLPSLVTGASGSRALARVAVAYDGVRAAAPLFHIEYVP
jgi:hypothetical protein